MPGPTQISIETSAAFARHPERRRRHQSGRRRGDETQGLVRGFCGCPACGLPAARRREADPQRGDFRLRRRQVLPGVLAHPGRGRQVLLGAKHGPAYMPPPPRGTVFLDVPKSDPFAGWIEQLWSEGISGGCGAGKFCGPATLNRATLAVLLLKATHGAAFRPPAGTGVFSDVPYTDVYAGWIEQLSREGITSGCGASTFCPEKVATRGEMALFLVRAFDLP